MLERNRAVYAKAYKELEEEGVFDDIANILNLKHKTNRRTITAKKPGSIKATAKKPKRRAVANRCVKLSAKK